MKKKYLKKKKNKVSPAARKMANEAKVDLSKVEGIRKKWCNFKRRYYEFNGILNLLQQREKLNMVQKKELK